MKGVSSANDSIPRGRQRVHEANLLSARCPIQTILDYGMRERRKDRDGGKRRRGKDRGGEEDGKDGRVN